MATVPKQRRTREVNYPTTDGKPIGETELHIDELIDAFQVLRDWYAACAERLRRRRPDALLRRGQPAEARFARHLRGSRCSQETKREYYLLWKEGKGPDFVVEITSKSTRREDMQKKFVLCRDVLKVSEYFLFDPRAEYLDPRLRGFRLTGGDYVPIEPIDGRLPSQVVGLHLSERRTKLADVRSRDG